MKKKLICILIFSMLLMTGCSKSEYLKIAYSDSVKEETGVIMPEEEFKTESMFAQDLCVIPLGTDTSEDGNLPAESNLIVNISGNKVIYADNIYERLYPASITKIMTALVVLKYGNLEDTVTVSYNASHITESGAKLCGLKEGDKIKLNDLLSALLIYSGNDAGIAIAEHVGGSEEKFAKLMNEEALKLGAVDSHFVNAHGLHNDKHYTTAYDLYLIFNELIKTEKFVEIISENAVEFTYTDKSGNSTAKTYENTNRYIKGTEKAPEGIHVIGGKTGTTYKAGNCLILYSKDDNDEQYISVVLKSDSGDALFSQMTYLLKMIHK